MRILDLLNAISRKRCKIGAKLVLVTNRKSHTSFRLVPYSVTLDDLERRNSFSVKVQYFLQWKCRPKNLGFSAIYHLAILAEDHPQRERLSEALLSR